MVMEVVVVIIEGETNIYDSMMFVWFGTEQLQGATEQAPKRQWREETTVLQWHTTFSIFHAVNKFKVLFSIFSHDV